MVAESRFSGVVSLGAIPYSVRKSTRMAFETGDSVTGRIRMFLDAGRALRMCGFCRCIRRERWTGRSFMLMLFAHIRPPSALSLVRL